MGAPKGTVPWNKKNIDEDYIAHLYFEQKLSSVDIGGLFDIHYSTIRNRLLKYGEMRSNSKAHKGQLPHNKKLYYEPLSNRGQIVIRIPKNDKYYCMTFGNGNILQHRYKMAKHIGRPLFPSEVVHHKDGDVRNNNISNLELYESHSQHMRTHMTYDRAKAMAIKGNKQRTGGV